MPLDDTVEPSAYPSQAHSLTPALTIAYHPVLSRIGERVLGFGSTLKLSRTEPEFVDISGRARPLDESHVSRAPLSLKSVAGDWIVDPGEGRTSLRIDAQPVSGMHVISASDFARGVVIELGRRVVLLFHPTAAVPRRPGHHDLIGVSDAIEAVRTEIDRVAARDVSVLLRGESGVGKELVAGAIHLASDRSQAPYVCVNMAAIPATMAAGELFGHERGAFTGAVAKHAGYFEAADGGTLFLDEIGVTNTEVQAMLLRALETGEIQLVGGRGRRHVNVRVIAATDSNLEHSIEHGEFRLPLLHRLAGYEITIPPLRTRREDVLPLFLHFVSLAGGVPDEVRWLNADVAARLLSAAWPGNAREVRNVAQRMTISDPEASVSLATLERLIGTFATAEPSAPVESEPTPSRRRSDLARIDDASLIEALENNRWQASAAARQLGISRTSIYQLMERCSGVRKASELEAQEILEARAACEGDLSRMAAFLRVSDVGLRRRLSELDIG